MRYIRTSYYYYYYYVMPAIPVTPAIVSDSSMHSASDDSQTPPLQNRGRPRSRGRPPGRRRRPVSPTPARQWTEHFTDEVPKRYTGPRPEDQSMTTQQNLLLVLETFQVGLLFPDEFIDEIVDLTNMNFAQKKARSPTKHKNKMKWSDVTCDELKSWFGVVIGMGLIQLKGDIRAYWSTRHTLTRTVGFPEVFPRDRFRVIPCQINQRSPTDPLRFS